MKRAESDISLQPMTSLKPTRRGRPAISDHKRTEMRSKIAASTQRLFHLDGYRQISMRRIATEVGCSAMTLYQYYDSKVEILHTLWVGVFDEIFNRINELDVAEETPSKQLILLASAYVDYWLENTEHYRLVFMTEGIDQSDVSTFIDNPDIASNYQIFAIAISNASPHEISADELKRKLDVLICFLNGIAHNLITISGYDWPATEVLVDMATRAAINT